MKSVCIILDDLSDLQTKKQAGGAGKRQLNTANKKKDEILAEVERKKEELELTGGRKGADVEKEREARRCVERILPCSNFPSNPSEWRKSVQRSDKRKRAFVMRKRLGKNKSENVPTTSELRDVDDAKKVASS